MEEGWCIQVGSKYYVLPNTARLKKVAFVAVRKDMLATIIIPELYLSFLLFKRHDRRIKGRDKIIIIIRGGNIISLLISDPRY